MTDKQKRTLEKFGVNTSQLNLSAQEAYDLIGEMYKQNSTNFQARREESQRLFEEARKVDLIDVCDTHVKKWHWESKTDARKTGICPMSGCSSKEDAFYINENGLGGCRKCEWHKAGNGSGAVGFVCAYEGVEWYEAVRIIMNHRDLTPAQPQPNEPQPNEPRPARTYFAKKWNWILSKCRQQLRNSKSMKYLESRGISYETATTFGVGHTDYGYGPYKGWPTALFAYYDASGKLCAVNRRVSANVNDKKNKTRFADGSKKIGYFGLSGFSNLVWVVEGEINAMSVYQHLIDHGHSDSVISLSSESDLTNRVADLHSLSEHKQVIIWCDQKHIRDELRSHGFIAYSTRQDANDLLRRGNLATCIDWILNNANQVFAKRQQQRLGFSIV